MSAFQKQTSRRSPLLPPLFCHLDPIVHFQQLSHALSPLQTGSLLSFLCFGSIQGGGTLVRPPAYEIWAKDADALHPFRKGLEPVEPAAVKPPAPFACLPVSIALRDRLVSSTVTYSLSFQCVASQSIHSFTMQPTVQYYLLLRRHYRIPCNTFPVTQHCYNLFAFIMRCYCL